MSNPLSRLLLAASSAVLLFGGAVHTLAFKKLVAAVAVSNLPPFFAKAFKALWLIDSTMLITSSIVFGLIAARPAIASRIVIAFPSFAACDYGSFALLFRRLDNARAFASYCISFGVLIGAVAYKRLTWRSSR